jgi:DNA-binding GntR family transcriptional regulator
MWIVQTARRPLRNKREEPTDQVAAQLALDPLGEQVYALLRARIISGQLRPGQKLSDLRLSGELNVSRTPVREALYRLAQDGIVQAVRRRGFIVTRLTRRNVQDLYEVRLGLELLAVRLGGPRLAAGSLAEMRRRHDAIVARVPDGVDAILTDFWTVDRALHHALFQATGNERLIAMREALQAQLDVLPVYGLRTEPLVLLSLEEHAPLIAALERGEWVGAEAAMTCHITSIQAYVLSAFDEQAP